MINYLLKIDKSFFLFLNSFHFSILNPFMNFFSGQIIWIPVLCFFIWKSFKDFGKKPTALFILFLILIFIASDVTSSYVLKNIFLRLRPCRELDLKPLIYQFGQRCGGKYGFVSSHAANSVALIFFSLNFLKLNRTYYLFWLLPLFVSYSRIYLGAHYPGDILGGILVGFFWGFLFFIISKNLKVQFFEFPNSR